MNLTTVRIAWRNLWRSKRRSGLAIVAVGVGQFALLAANGIMHGYADNIRTAVTGPWIGHAQVHAPGWREEWAADLTIEHADRVVETIAAAPGVEGAGCRIYAPVLVAPDVTAHAALVAGVDTEVESGRFGLLSGLESPLGAREVLAGYILARRIGLEAGDEVAVVGQAADGSIANDLFVVRDIIKCPADLINQMGIVMSLADAQELLVMSDQAHEIVIRATHGGEEAELVTQLKSAPALAGLELLSWEDLVPELVVVLKVADYVGYIVVCIVFVAAIAGITNTLMMSTYERMHEFGMLLALGTTPGRLVRMIVVEALLLGALGVIVGTAGGYGFEWLTSGTGIDLASWGGGEVADIAYKGLNLPLCIFPRLEVRDCMIGLVAVTVTSLLASIWPAATAAGLEPMEAMHT